MQDGRREKTGGEETKGEGREEPGRGCHLVHAKKGY